MTGKSLKDSQYMKTLNYQPVWGLDQQSSSCTGQGGGGGGGTSSGGGRQRKEAEVAPRPNQGLYS